MSAPRLVTRALVTSFLTVALVLAAVFAVLSLRVRDQVRQAVADNLASAQQVFTRVEARRQLEKVEVDLDPTTPTRDLSFATRQMVELARVMTIEDRTQHEPIVILDEPTTVLDGTEVELLFARLRSLQRRLSVAAPAGTAVSLG